MQIGLRAATVPPTGNDLSPRADNSDFDGRQRSLSQPPASQSKSVSFDLDGDGNRKKHRDRNPDRGYETDDSDSTIDGNDANRSRKHHHSRRRRSSYSAPAPSSSTSRHQVARSSHISQPKAPGDVAKDSDSESTIDLPDRFDAQGRRLPDPEEEDVATHIERLLHGFGDVLLDTPSSKRGGRR